MNAARCLMSYRALWGARVSHRLQRLEIPVYPERAMFRVHDSGADPNGPGAPLLPVGSLISVSADREQLWVGSLQEQVAVSLTLEEWDGAPVTADWDEEAKTQLYLRGRLTIDMGSSGIAVGSLRLIGGVGDYAARVYARNREPVAELYNDLFDRYGDPLGDEFARAKKDLEGIEQYLLQLWRES
ncbi:MAG: hypothetical protein J2P30_19575 [Actinobacteria bacterium]|nr:hypothetical protein [Actinomycetota bacterium]